MRIQWKELLKHRLPKRFNKSSITINSKNSNSRATSRSDLEWRAKKVRKRRIQKNNNNKGKGWPACCDCVWQQCSAKNTWHQQITVDKQQLHRNNVYLNKSWIDLGVVQSNSFNTVTSTGFLGPVTCWTVKPIGRSGDTYNITAPYLNKASHGCKRKADIARSVHDDCNSSLAVQPSFVLFANWI